MDFFFQLKIVNRKFNYIFKLKVDLVVSMLIINFFKIYFGYMDMFYFDFRFII